MPRNLRIEYPGAVYHVFNRGNYRQGCFAIEGMGTSFEQTLFETCDRFGWQLCAYVLMPDHFHLCVKTQDGQLVSGMQWLQSTFSNRFNKRVKDCGHVFQGRYKALLIEEGEALLRVVNYIHLNPVRSGTQSMETLRQYELSSFPKFFRSRGPACLVSRDWLRLAGNLKDTPAGMRCYHRYLAAAAEEQAGRKGALRTEFCRGWYIGTKEGKRSLLKALKKGRLGAGDQAQAVEDRAEHLLKKGLRRLGRSSRELQTDLKLAQWKVVLAAWIKLQCGVTNRWFSETMHMGSIYGVSKAVAGELRGRSQSKAWRALGPADSKA